MIYLLYTIHVVVCLFLIMVVLLQQGKGADLSVFGGGATQAAFGARGAVSLLHKLTVWGFVAFIVTTISIGFMVSSSTGGSVMSDVPTESAPAAASETPAEMPAEQLPAAAEEPGAADSGAAESGAAEAPEGGGESADESTPDQP